jgi:4-diphosphocytidyl-2-C-methyl-D-erythritol kinase
MRSRVTVAVPAKVNLQLGVGPVRPDGYHELVTIFHAVDLLDTITATPAEGVSLSVRGEDADSVPTDGTNLAWRAAIALAEYADVAADVHIEIAKAIPVAGGMAGGSADAAATLIACDALWGTELDREELHHLAAGLGSDVPFALEGGTAIGMGRGEQLTTVLTRGTFHWAFAIADGGLSTPAVYRQCDVLRENESVADPEVDEDIVTALAHGDARALGRALTNDLQRAAVSLRPSLGDLLDAGDELGALGQIVSGSGPTCAFLARDAEHALDIAVGLTATGLCRTVKRASGPVSGARLI